MGCVSRLTLTIATTDRGKANKIGSIANQGYTSIKTSFPNNNLQSPTGTASALCKNNIANILAKAPVKPVSIPVQGWDHFQQYLRSNIKQPFNEKGEPVKGVVLLSFRINESGTPVNIKVQQSVSKACDKEAIRLLQNGPKWTYANKKKVRVEIAF